MLSVIYLIIIVLLTALLGSIVPLVQYVTYRLKLRVPSKFLFSQTLLDYNMDGLKYETISATGGSFINRLSLSNRGWIRGPNGIIMTDEDFEAKKKSEYDIALP